MKKNKIIISANVLFTISNFRKDVIKFLLSKNFEVVCIADSDELSNSSEKILQDLNVKFIKIDISRRGVNPFEDFKYFLNLIRIYKKENPILVMHFTIKPNTYGTLAAKILGIPSINTINGLGSAIIRGDVLSKILKYFYKFSLSFSSKVFFQNSDDLDFFVSNKLVNPQKTGIVPGSGVDTLSFGECKSNNEKLTFLLVSRLLKDKGIYEYVNAIKELGKYKETCRFLLAGQFDFGNPSAITEDEVENWKKSSTIEFLGKTDNIKELLKLADVIVLPSYREGLSRVLIESASASKPIITTNVAGCKDVVVEDKNGYLCEVKSSDSLRVCMEKMILLPSEERKKMSNYSKEYVTGKFDKEIVNKIYYEEIKKYV